jgi:excisionase family DNA binding protein
MFNQTPAKDSPTPTKYRLSEDKAAAIRTNPPCNMTVMEAASFIACSPRKLRELIQSRKIKSARVGAKIVIRREWLDAFLGA